jgi:hypothetical protein
MGKQPDKHIQDLIKQMRALQAAKKALSARDDIDRIIEMIKLKRGWTTPAEFAFAKGIAKSLTSRISGMTTELGEFKNAAAKVEAMM